MAEKRLPLTEFQSWLFNDRHLAASTTGLYVSLVRAFLRDPMNASVLASNGARLSEEAILFDSGLKENTRKPFRVAIRAFARYLEVKGGLDLSSEAFFRFPDKRRGRKGEPRIEEPEPIDPLAEALGEILRKIEKSGIPWNHVPMIRWRDVRGGGMEFCFVEDKQGENTYQIPKETIVALGMWAGKGERPNPNQPFVPHEAGGFSAMTARRLVRIARGP